MEGGRVVYKMSGKEFVEIFKELDLQRSPTVKTLEEQISTLQKFADDAFAKGDLKRSEELQRMAEETKWVAIDLAESEKEAGYCFMT